MSDIKLVLFTNSNAQLSVEQGVIMNRTIFLSILLSIATISGDAMATTRVVVVGEDNFAVGDHPIANGAYYCSEIRNLLANTNGVEVSALCASDATRANVMAALAETAHRAKPDDASVVVFLGHGYKLRDDDIGIVPYDWDLNNPSQTGLSAHRDIIPMFAEIDGTILVLSDLVHKASHRWTKSDKTTGYVLLHGPVANDFVGDNGNVVAISATDGDDFPSVADSAFGDAIVGVIKDFADGTVKTVTIGEIHKHLFSALHEKGRWGSVSKNVVARSGDAILTHNDTNTPTHDGMPSWVEYSSTGIASVGVLASGEEYLRMRKFHTRLVDGDYQTQDEYGDIVAKRDNAYRNAQILGAVGIASAVGVVTTRIINNDAGRNAIAVSPTTNGIKMAFRW